MTSSETKEDLSLGRLEAVPLRTVWEHEACDFTPWLAKAENLVMLGNALGLRLAFDSQEKRIGVFKADIVCKDELSDSYVLIENQLEQTNHQHLGQILTYAAGIDRR